MAVPQKVTADESQQYYERAESIRIKPGWMQGEGQPMPTIEPYLWRWSEVEPLVMKSGELVTPDRDVERRTLRRSAVEKLSLSGKPHLLVHPESWD